MTPELIIYPFLIILIGLFFVSFFLIWHWFDARELLHIVRADTKEKTLKAMRKGHNKCRILLIINILLAIGYVPVPFVYKEYMGTLVYPALVFVVAIVILLILRKYTKEHIASIDEYIVANEAHVQEAAEARAREREEWKREAATLNPIAEQKIKELMGENYEVWYKHDILVGRNVLANMEEGLLYAQGIVIPFAEIREVRHGRKDLKLITDSSTHPFITLDFGAIPINPETGNKYKDEIAERIEKILDA
jgi:hypothetical protein